MAEEKAEANSSPKIGKSNLILIIVIAVLATLLVGGGITAAIVLTKGSAPEHAAEQPVADEASADAQPKKSEKSKKDDKNKKDGPKAPAIYVALEPPFVVNFDATQSSRFLQVTVELMTRDSSMAQMLKDNDPAIRNDLLMLFGGQIANDIGTRDGKEVLRKETLETVRSLVKNEGGNPELVEAVYFTTFVMQ